MIDFSGKSVPPLKFVLQREYEPVGIVEHPSTGIVACHTPWYTEFGLQLVGMEGVAVLYMVPTDEQSVLLAACIDNAFEPFFGLVSGHDYGDEVTLLTEKHWPEVHSMLVRSNGGLSSSQGMILANLATPRRVQWIVGEQLPAAEAGEIARDQVLALVGTAVQTFLRVTNVATELPGVIPVLGSPDRTARRLRALGGLFGAGADLSGVLKDGVDPAELGTLGRAVLDAIESARGLTD